MFNNNLEISQLSTLENIKLTFQTELENYNELVDAGFILHGHVCPAMPLGLRAALEALKKLDVPRARNKELHVLMENGPAHAALCFSEGVQLGTSATIGKGEMTRTNKGKNAFVLIEKSTGKSIRVSIKYEFFEKIMQSEFVMKRKAGVEPYEIDQKLPEKMIQNMLNAPVDSIFEFGEIMKTDLSQAKGTFNYHQCSSCLEPVYEPGIRIRDGKYLCIDCAE